jgi:hypothetical protein
MAVEQMKRGAVDFLQKPVSVKPLQTALEHGLAASGERFARQKERGLLSAANAQRAGACAAGGERADESGDCGDNEHCRTHGGGPSGEGDGKDAGGESGGVSQHLTAGYRVILMIPMNEAWRTPGGNKKRRLISEHKNW